MGEKHKKQVMSRAERRLRSADMRAGFEGGGTLQGVQEFLERKGIKVMPIKELEQYQKSEEFQAIRERCKKAGGFKRKKSKGKKLHAPNPWNPSNYNYGSIHIVRG